MCTFCADRRNLYFISVLCSYSSQLSADKAEGSPGASRQIFRPREAGLQGPKPQGHYRLTQDFFSPFFLSFDRLPQSLLHLRGSISSDSISHHEPVAGNRVSLNHHATLETYCRHVNMTKHSSAHIIGAQSCQMSLNWEKKLFLA